MEQTPLKLNLQAELDSKELPTDEPFKYVTVTCRLKPLLPQEEKSKIEVDKVLHQITMNDPTKSISKSYTFDHVFDQTICQDRFANSICNPLIKFLKQGGESGLIFSYGITNSGKTYTILGTNDQPGILLTLIKKLQRQFPDERLRIVACQLYKDEFMSLKNKGQKLQPKEVKGTISFDDCDSDQINESNMEELFANYLQNRSCSSTVHNNLSSRSHAIFKITTRHFKIGIVDLAGSQRTSKHGEHIVDIKETVFINSSLLTLKKCIKALEERSFVTQKLVVPYRESKLTQALMEYFVNNSKINIIVNINQARHCLEQNLNAMDYTSKAKNITANATSDFSKMLKSTAKKKNEMFSVIKHKTIQSATQQVKRYSAQLFGEKKFIIDEEMIEAEELEASLERQIELQQRRSELMRRQTDQMFDQLMQGPVSIEEFIQRQQHYRDYYLATDFEIERQADERKLSAYRKVNLMETTEKKHSESQRKLVYPVETMEVGTEIGRDLINESQELNNILAKMEYEKLRTQVKKKLMSILDEERRKMLVDSETMYSERKMRPKTVEKFGEAKIEETSVQDEESNYTTPSKKCSRLAKSAHKSAKSLHKSVKSISKPENKNIFTMVTSGAKSTINGIKSGVKSGFKMITDMKNSIIKSKPNQDIKPKGPKFNMKLTQEISLLVQPHNKITYEIATETETEVDIVPSSKKVRVWQNQPKISEDGEVDIDAYPELVEKEVTVETFEVGIQTDQFEVKHAFQQGIDGALKDQREKRHQKQQEKKGKKTKKGTKDENSYIHEHVVHEENEEDTFDGNQEKPNRHNMQSNTKFHIQGSKVPEKTAFKHFSVNKRVIEVSMKKHKAFVSAAKMGIAKNTRGAQKKKFNNH